MKKLLLVILAMAFFSGCITTYNAGTGDFCNMGTAACSYHRTLDGKVTIVIAEDSLLPDVIKVLIESGVIK